MIMFHTITLHGRSRAESGPAEPARRSDGRDRDIQHPFGVESETRKQTGCVLAGPRISTWIGKLLTRSGSYAAA